MISYQDDMMISSWQKSQKMESTPDAIEQTASLTMMIKMCAIGKKIIIELISAPAFDPSLPHPDVNKGSHRPDKATLYSSTL